MPATWSAGRSWTGSASTSAGWTIDFFLLFGPDATWDTTPPQPVGSGATVIDNSDRLADSAAPLLR